MKKFLKPVLAALITAALAGVGVPAFIATQTADVVSDKAADAVIEAID